jgi:transposase
MAEGRRRKDVAELARVSLPTEDRWLDRYADEGVAGLAERKRGAGPNRDGYSLDSIMGRHRSVWTAPA